MTEPRKIRVAILNTHPIQYFAPLYAYLNADPAFDITALYMSDYSLRGARDPGFGQAVSWDVDLLAGYRSVFLGAAAKTRKVEGFFSLCAPEAWGEIRSGRYDALIIHGHNFAANFVALAAAKSMGMTVLVRGEMHMGLPNSRLKVIARRPLMGTFFTMCDRALAIGSANAEYYRAMGVADAKIFIAPYSVDNARFMDGARMSDSERGEWRRHFGIPEGVPAMLYAAKFSRRKHPDTLLAAVRQVRQGSARPFAMVMCGSGELEAELRAYCAAEGLDNVVFTGFVNQAALPKLYGSCDAFVLPSEREPWGLAVNEAMCASLPIVVSREVGCVADLVSDGVNGFTPEAGDVGGLAASLKTLIEDEDLRRRQGAASLERISHWGYREFAQGLRRALGKESA